MSNKAESLFDINSWRALKLEGDARAAWCSHLQHLQSSVSDRNEKCVSGITLWAATLGTANQRVGIAWTWLRMGREVVALADPMRISSNARLVSADGLHLTPDQALLHLNNIVNALPWQAEVLKLERSGSGSSIGSSIGSQRAALAARRVAMAAVAAPPLQAYV